MTDNYFAKVTPINDLPDLQDLERGNNFNQVQKFIRSSNANHVHPNSGMADSVPVPQYSQEPFVPPPAQPRMYAPPPPLPPREEPAVQEPYNYYPASRYERSDRDEPSCMDLAAHVKRCPICSRFYNNDRTLYIITIIVLAIICLLLLKRVLNV